MKVLKRSRISSEEILFVHAAQEHLATRGFVDAPRFQATPDGLPYCRVDGGLYIVTDWVEASHSRLRQTAELDAAIAKIAELHRMSCGFAPPTGPPRDRIRWGRWPEIFRARLDQLAVFRRLAREAHARTAFDRKYMGLLEHHWDQAATAIAMLLRTAYRRLMDLEQRSASFCHHDLTYRNILFRKDGGVHLLDLEYCICDSRLHDLGSLILRRCKRLGWRISTADAILEMYGRYAERKLIPEEYEVLTAFLHWPQDYWQVGLQYYVEKQPWPLSRFLSSLERKTSDRREREAFLVSFRRRYAPDLTL
jgi:CotS family spore coat protein